MTTQAAAPAVEIVYLGKIDAMIAEVSALDMGKAWFKEYGYRYAVLALGNVQYDTTFCPNLAEAKAVAREIAQFHGVKIAYV